MSLLSVLLKAEFRYQRFVIARSRNGLFWIILAVILLAPSLLLSLWYTLALFVPIIEPVPWGRLPQTLHFGSGLMLIVVNISMYTVVTLVTIALSNQSVRREKVQHTWALLRMSAVRNHEIVIGKWWAGLWSLNGDHAMVLWVRVGLLALYLAIFLPAYHQINGDPPAAYTLYFVATVPLILLQGFLDAALSTILGVLGAIPNAAWQTVASFTTMLLRLVTAIMVGLWLWQLLLILAQDFVGALQWAAAGTFATLLAVMMSVFIAQYLIDQQ